MKKAGLNPLLMMGSGSAAEPYKPPDFGAVGSTGFSSAMDAKRFALEQSLNREQVAKTKADSAVSVASAANVIADTALKGAQLPKTEAVGKIWDTAGKAVDTFNRMMKGSVA